MQEKYEVIFEGIGSFIACAALITGIVLITCLYSTYEHEPIGEGEVIDLKIEPEGGFISRNFFFVKLNNSKWYDIKEKSYDLLEIGMYIQVLRGGDVVILSP